MGEERARGSAPTPACPHPQNAAVGRRAVLVSRCGVPGDLRPASPLPPAGPRHPSLCQGLGEQWGKAKVTWAPGTCNRLVARATAFLTEQMRTREGERLAQGHPPAAPRQCRAEMGPGCLGPVGPGYFFPPELAVGSRGAWESLRVRPSVSDKEYGAQQGACPSRGHAAPW